MARPLRIQFPGAFYHVTSRGNEQKNIYKSEQDREKFLSYLESAVERYGAVIHVYCLMSNHYHLLLETPNSNLSQIMRHINGAYTTYYNTKRKRAGHLFQGRFKAILVEKDQYATTLSRYIHLNPVRAGITAKPVEYDWSSYRFYTGSQKTPEWITTEFILGYFGRNNSSARKGYRKFVHDLVKQEYESPLKEVIASTLLGSIEFVKDVQEKYLFNAKNDRDIPALTELSKRKSIDEIRQVVDSEFGSDTRLAKKAMLYFCHKISGRKLKEIGMSFGIGESAVSLSSRRFRVMIAKDKTLKKKIMKIQVGLGL